MPSFPRPMHASLSTDRERTYPAVLASIQGYLVPWSDCPIIHPVGASVPAAPPLGAGGMSDQPVGNPERSRRLTVPGEEAANITREECPHRRAIHLDSGAETIDAADGVARLEHEDGMLLKLALALIDTLYKRLLLRHVTLHGARSRALQQHRFRPVAYRTAPGNACRIRSSLIGGTASG